jgi:hypothetical protein
MSLGIRAAFFHSVRKRQLNLMCKRFTSWKLEIQQLAKTSTDALLTFRSPLMYKVTSLY